LAPQGPLVIVCLAAPSRRVRLTADVKQRAMAWVRDIKSLYNFIGYVVLRAPDRFPKEDYLSDAEQMTLEHAFTELRNGVALVEADFPGADVQRGLSALLQESFAAYESGNEMGGAHKLQEFGSRIFKEG
jgi:hypothetical protein